MWGKPIRLRSEGPRWCRGSHYICISMCMYINIYIHTRVCLCLLSLGCVCVVCLCCVSVLWVCVVSLLCVSVLCVCVASLCCVSVWCVYGVCLWYVSVLCVCVSLDSHITRLIIKAFFFRYEGGTSRGTQHRHNTDTPHRHNTDTPHRLTTQTRHIFRYNPNTHDNAGGLIIYNESVYIYMESCHAYNESRHVYNESCHIYNESWYIYNESWYIDNESCHVYTESCHTYNKSSRKCVMMQWVSFHKMSHVTLSWVMSHSLESCHTLLSHVKYTMSHVKYAMSHVTCTMSHVTLSWVISNIQCFFSCCI